MLMSTENKTTIRGLYRTVFDERDLEQIADVYSDDAEVHIPGTPEDPFGSEAIRRLFGMILSAFPDVRCVVEDLIAEGDKVVARTTLHPASGTLDGITPQARLGSWQRIDIYRLFQGRIIEHWGDRDDMSTLLHLGIVPPSERKEGYVSPDGGRQI
jgi:predicted ester cyclase